jgi:prepilin-type N-terminal cleavage/methylation domain-containing protein
MRVKLWHLLKVKTNEAAGFTLLETMIGMMIFAVGISAALYMQVEGINAHVRSKQHVEAAHGIIQQAETIGLAMQYDSHLLKDDGNTFGSGNMPITEEQHASYTVRRDNIVQGTKMIYLSNRIKAGAKAYTIGRVQPYLGKGSDDE